jgi:hypothetical protein
MSARYSVTQMGAYLIRARDLLWILEIEIFIFHDE